MKQLLTGNEAIARGAWEAGVSFGAAYPGTPSTEITENLALYDEIYAEWAPNEKVALEVGIGAAMAGRRTIVSLKHVGLNVAADPFCTFAYTGTPTGLVVVCADDPEMHSSQNEQDNRYYAKLAKVPMLEPSDSQEALEFVKLAFDISEKYDTPVLLITTTRISHSRAIVNTGRRKKIKQKAFEQNPPKYVMVPAFARLRHKAIVERMELLKEYSEKVPVNRIEKGDKDIGIITSAVSYQYAKEVFPDASVLKLGMTNPLPEKLIKKFAKSVKKIYVIEELEPYLEDSIKAMGIDVIGKKKLPVTGELNPDIVKNALVRKRRPHPVEDTSKLPVRPPNLCAGCPHRGTFTALKPLKTVVFGDIGCYTLSVLPPLSTHDMCVCMGASIGISHGYAKAAGEDAKKCVGVLGDSTFLHSGLTGVLEMAYNKGMNTVLVLDNRTTAMTGGQEHPATGRTLKGEPANAVDLVEVCKALGIKNAFSVDPFKIKETRKIIRRELARDEPSVLVSTAPCPLQAKIRHTPMFVDEDKCIECGSCSKINCPAISSAGGKPVINTFLCNGCTVCAQICPKKAIKVIKKK